MDKIILNELTFYGYHGLFPEENKLGQRFIVDLELELDLSEAGKSDDMTKSIDYGHVYKIAQEVVEGETKRLVEAVAESLSHELFKNLPLLEACTVKVIKPDPPIPGHYQSVGVQIHRKREQQ